MGQIVTKSAHVHIAKIGSVSSRFDAAARRVFLEHLAATANVSASARKAGIPASRAYQLRRKNEGFRGEWAEALAEGFARLEMDLLAEALTNANGNIKDSTLKARAQKHRLALALLAAHRASVKGANSGGEAGAIAPGSSADEMREELATRIEKMRSRMVENSAG